jgi:hypothetical protein
MRYRLPNTSSHQQLGVRGWLSVAIAFAIFAAGTILISVLALGFLIVALPVVGLGAAYIYYLRKKLAGTMLQMPGATDPIQSPDRQKVIEGTYSALDSKEL